MKTILIFLFTITLSAQHTFSFGVDAKNLIYGSQPTNNEPALDFQVRFLGRQNHVEVGIAYEQFSRIAYRDVMFFVNYVTGQDLQVAIGAEHGIGIRNDNMSFITLGGNAEIRYFINNIGISLQANTMYRPDLYVLYRSDKDWVYSGFVNICYRIEQKSRRLQ